MIDNEYQDRLWRWFIEALEESGQTISLDEELRADMRYAICRVVEQEIERVDAARAASGREELQ